MSSPDFNWRTLWVEFDKDADGTWHQSEFVVFFLARLTPLIQKAAQSMFKGIQKAAGNKLARGELQKYLKRQSWARPVSDMDEYKWKTVWSQHSNGQENLTNETFFAFFLARLFPHLWYKSSVADRLGSPTASPSSRHNMLDLANEKQAKGSPKEKPVAAVGVCTKVINYHTDYVLFVRYSSDGSMFAAACHDGTISLWETKNYTNIGTFKGHSGAVFCCFFSADDETLVSCSGDMSLRLWDVKTQKCVGTCKGHKEPVRFCSYAENGRYLLSASYDSDVKLWDTTDLDPGELVEYACIATATGHKGRVRGCGFSDDCKTAASCGDDKTVRLYDVPSMKETAVLRAHTEQVFCVSFAPDNETMATGGYDDTLRLWNYKTRQNTHTWNTAAHVFACDFGPRGFLSSCGDDMIISLYHVSQKKLAAQLVGHTSSTFSCDFHPNKLEIISGSHDKTMRVWDQQKVSERERTFC